MSIFCLRGWIVVLLLVVAGCAAPQKLVYDFIPPASKAGLSCLTSCQAKATACERQVDVLARQCLVKAGQQAKTELPGRIAAYENSLLAWQKAMRRYQRDISMYELQMRHYRMMNHISSACRGKKGNEGEDCRRHAGFIRSSLWPVRPLFPGDMPERPTMKNIKAEIAGKNCSQEKQHCAAGYRQCYTSCGGTVKAR